MAAAAYAKELLYRIPPNKLEAGKRISDIISGVQVGVSILLHRQHDQEDEDILNWLTPIDYTLQQTDYFKRRQPGTGQWLLDNADFHTWLNTNGQTLFCPGIPGAGKTILTSVVVESLHTKFQHEPKIGIAYLYCNFRRQNEQGADDLLASLLQQLARGQPFLPESVKILYSSHKDKRTLPSLDEISRTLESVASLYSRVFIFVDALDECQASHGWHSRFLSQIFTLQARCGLNIFATSRPIPEVTSNFSQSMRVEIRASDEDVRRFLEGHMGQLPSFVQRNRQLQDEIKNEISEAADGMFLLAQIYLDSLHDKITVTAIKSALRRLQKLKRGSSEDQKLEVLRLAYDQAMERINGQMPGFCELARHVLSWITCANRPLSTSELQHALAVEAGKPELDTENLPLIETVVSVCAGLVTVDEESSIIRLVHYTAQEYFEGTREWFPDAESEITTICVTYLSFSVFESGFCRTNDEFRQRLKTNQLYDYAAKNWGHHARTAFADAGKLIVEFLESEHRVVAASQVMMAGQRYSGATRHSQTKPKQITGLHVAAYYGLREVIISLLHNGQNADSRDSYGQTPLSYAAEIGHAAAVKLLLETQGVDANSSDDDARTPLSYAAEEGHQITVELLIKAQDIKADSRDRDGRTPLSYASERGHETIVRLLLEAQGVDAHFSDYNSRPPMSYAAERGHPAVIKLLLEAQGVDSRSGNRRTRAPLSYAAEEGHVNVVELLLKAQDVAADSRDRDGRTPLSYAAEKGHKTVVNLLLKTQDVEADSPDRYGHTPLWYANEGRHIPIVKLLQPTP